MSNVYGFDFLKSEHNESDSQLVSHSTETELLPAANVDVPSVEDKPDGEKQFDVIQFLKAHRSSGCLPPSVIHKSIGIDLSEGARDEKVRKSLLDNPKIRVEEIPDPENPSLTIYTFGYQAKYKNVENKTGLLAQINDCKNGVRQSDLIDAYETAKEDIASLITAGDVMAVINSDDKDKILFPRGDTFIVELDGNISLPDETVGIPMQKALSNIEMVSDDLRRAQLEIQQSSHLMKTDVNPMKQVRRGEAVWCGGQWFRVSSAVREGVPLSEQPLRAQAPPSVSLRKELSKKNDSDGYIRPFNEKLIPLDHKLEANARNNIRSARQAHEMLHKIAVSGHRVTGGACAKLLSSNANADNPDDLGTEFASTTSSGSSNVRRRTNSHRVSITSHHAAASNQIEAAKKAASNPALSYNHARRYGCTIDVRNLYLETKNEIPLPEQEVDMYNLMLKYKLLDPDEDMRRPRMARNENLGDDGKPKKRRYYERKGQRMTNTHLVGTEIGQALTRAMEKQQQGKAVGDGGM